MNPKMSIRNREGIFEDFQETDEPIKQRDGFETCWDLPEEFGKGSSRKAEFRPGFDLYVTNYALREHVVINVDCSSIVGFGFFVLGGMKTRVKGVKKDFVMDSGQSSLFYFPDPSGSGEGAANEHELFVSIQIDPRVFYTLIEREFDRIPADFRGIADGIEEKYYFRTSTITPLMQVALHQIFNCPYHGLTRRLYLESRALELIAYKLEQLVSAESRINKKFVLRPNEIERVHHAEELLIRDLENPPKLLELARAVGLSHTKLNFCFREMYGTTLFDYLHSMRLNKAKLLLDEGKTNVTEAAFSVGYSSPSHFIKAFKQHFGIPPGIYLREVLGKS